ncbi:MAG: hypothetical protein AAF333_08075 [Planctomycetota bacterium]
MIEVIDPTEREAVIEALGAAFADHPMVPADPRGRRSRLMVRALLDAFAGAPDATWFGVRRGGLPALTRRRR